MDLSTFPDLLLLATMQKMKSIPFCRSVRTRKKWKEVAEIYKKQFNIRMRSAKNGVYLLAFELVHDKKIIDVKLSEDYCDNIKRSRRCELNELAEALSVFGYFHIEKVLVTNWYQKFNEELFPILQGVNTRCDKLSTPVRYWAPEAFKAFRPCHWEVCGFSDDTDIKEMFLRRNGIAHINIDTPHQLTDRHIYGIIESGIDLSGAVEVSQEIMTFLGKWLDIMRLGRVPSQVAHIALWTNESRVSPDIERYLPFDVSFRLTLKFLDRNSPPVKILLCQMEKDPGKWLCIANCQETKSNVPWLHYIATDNWETFYTWVRTSCRSHNRTARSSHPSNEKKVVSLRNLFTSDQ